MLHRKYLLTSCQILYAMCANKYIDTLLYFFGHDFTSFMVDLCAFFFLNNFFLLHIFKIKFTTDIYEKFKAGWNRNSGKFLTDC